MVDSKYRTMSFTFTTFLLLFTIYKLFSILSFFFFFFFASCSSAEPTSLPPDVNLHVFAVLTLEFWAHGSQLVPCDLSVSDGVLGPFLPQFNFSEYNF